MENLQREVEQINELIDKKQFSFEYATRELYLCGHYKRLKTSTYIN